MLNFVKHMWKRGFPLPYTSHNYEVIYMKGYQALPEERCGNCKHFRQHYIRSSRGCYRPLRYGHCVHPMLKKRRVEEHCPYWEAKEAEGS